MVASVQQRFEDFLRTNGLVGTGSHILLAVSGGIDSMVMMHLFHQIQPSWELTLGVAHLNHGLRGEESDGDESFVLDAASRLGLPCVSERADVKAFQRVQRLSKQEAARELRYDFFERSRQALDADLVATAHHADDNAETVLMNALRGAGIHGLSGIPLRRENGIIRPLLFARRSEIRQYALEHRIRFREDSSNAVLDSTRNSLRHVLLPEMDKLLHTDSVESLNRLAASMRSLKESLDAELRDHLPAIVSAEEATTSVDIDALNKIPVHLQEEITLHLFRQLSIEPSVSKVMAFLLLKEHPTGKTLDLSGDWRVLRDRNRLVIHRAREVAAFEHEIELGKEYSFEGFTFGSDILELVPHTYPLKRQQEIVDADKLGSRLVLRSWRPGDTFVPLGMREPKKLSDFFVDQKLSRLEKRRVPLLESDGRIVWVCGMRIDNRFKITPFTRRAASLHFSLPLQ